MKLTNKLSVIMLLATINLSTFAKADEIVIPVITKPAVLQEGTFLSIKSLHDPSCFFFHLTNL